MSILGSASKEIKYTEILEKRIEHLKLIFLFYQTPSPLIDDETKRNFISGFLSPGFFRLNYLSATILRRVKMGKAYDY